MFSQRDLDFKMRITYFLFAFRMVFAKGLDVIENQKRMVPMFESTVPVSSLVNYYSQVFAAMRRCQCPIPNAPLPMPKLLMTAVL